jgi:hypothetical protein
MRPPAPLMANFTGIAFHPTCVQWHLVSACDTSDCSVQLTSRVCRVALSEMRTGHAACTCSLTEAA